MIRPGLIVGSATVVAAAGAMVVWLMLSPQTASLLPLSDAARTAAPAATIAVAESVSPPEVTSADFGQATAPPVMATATTAKDKETSSVEHYITFRNF